MIRLSQPVVVEGEYDRKKLLAIIDAPIFTTDGFGIFKDREKRALLRRCAQSCGVIVLTDSDGAGKLIRAHIESIAGEGARVTHLYIPKIAGKEKRKDRKSAEGFLGVEGMDEKTLSALFERYAASETNIGEKVTRVDLYDCALLGAPEAREKRRKLLSEMDLPTDLTVPRLLDAVNLFYTREQFFAYAKGL